MTREEQIELMKECVFDATTVTDPGIYSGYEFLRAALAVAFFNYRAQQKTRAAMPTDSFLEPTDDGRMRRLLQKLDERDIPSGDHQTRQRS